MIVAIYARKITFALALAVVAVPFLAEAQGTWALWMRHSGL